MDIFVRNVCTSDLTPIVLNMQIEYEKGIKRHLQSENCSGKLAMIGAIIFDPQIGSVKESLYFENKKRNVVCEREIDYSTFIKMDRAEQTAAVGRALIDCILQIPDCFISLDTKKRAIIAIKETCIELGGGEILESDFALAPKLHSKIQDATEGHYTNIFQLIIQYKIFSRDQADHILNCYESLDLIDGLDYDGHDYGQNKLNLFFYTDNPEEAKRLFIRLFQEGIIKEPAAMSIVFDGEYTLIYPKSDGEFEIF